MTTNLIDIQNSDVIMCTNNMAENHPVGFQWVMKAKERGAKVIHVDPRFTRTSAVSDIHVPLRSGTNIAFFGGLMSYAMQNNLYFKATSSTTRTPPSSSTPPSRRRPT
jgi:Anaerobic dehydrogenases, typically selenocysteine-containing